MRSEAWVSSGLDDAFASTRDVDADFDVVVDLDFDGDVDLNVVSTVDRVHHSILVSIETTPCSSSMPRSYFGLSTSLRSFSTSSDAAHSIASPREIL